MINSESKVVNSSKQHGETYLQTHIFFSEEEHVQMFSGACPRHITKAMLRAMLTVRLVGKNTRPAGFFFAGRTGHPQRYACGFFVGQPSVLKPAGFPQQLLLVIQQEKECIDQDLCNDSFKKKRCWKSNRTVLGDSSVCHSELLRKQSVSHEQTLNDCSYSQLHLRRTPSGPAPTVRLGEVSVLEGDVTRHREF